MKVKYVFILFFSIILKQSFSANTYLGFPKSKSFTKKALINDKELIDKTIKFDEHSIEFTNLGSSLDYVGGIYDKDGKEIKTFDIGCAKLANSTLTQSISSIYKDYKSFDECFFELLNRVINKDRPTGLCPDDSKKMYKIQYPETKKIEFWDDGIYTIKISNGFSFKSETKLETLARYQNLSNLLYIYLELILGKSFEEKLMKGDCGKKITLNFTVQMADLIRRSKSMSWGDLYENGYKIAFTTINKLPECAILMKGLNQSSHEIFGTKYLKYINDIVNVSQKSAAILSAAMIISNLVNDKPYYEFCIEIEKGAIRYCSDKDKVTLNIKSDEIILKRDILISKKTPEFNTDGNPIDFGNSFELNFTLSIDSTTSIYINIEGIPNNSKKWNSRRMYMTIGSYRGTDCYCTLFNGDGIGGSATDWILGGYNVPFFDKKLHKLTIRLTKNDLINYHADLLIDNIIQYRYALIRADNIKDDLEFQDFLRSEPNQGRFSVSAQGEGDIKIQQISYRTIPATKYFLNFIAFGRDSDQDRGVPKGACFVQWVKINDNQIYKEAYGYFPGISGTSVFAKIDNPTQDKYLPVPWVEGDKATTFRVQVSQAEFERSLSEKNKWISDLNRKQLTRNNSLEYIVQMQQSAKESIHNPFPVGKYENIYSFDAILSLETYANQSDVYHLFN